MRTLLPLLMVMAAGCAVPRQLPFKASMAPPPPPPDGAIAQKAAVRDAILKLYPQFAREHDHPETVLIVTTTTGRVERTDLLRGVPTAGEELNALFRRFADLRNDPTRTGAGAIRFAPGELANAPIVVVWAERAVQTAGRGLYRFTAPAGATARAPAAR